MRALAVGRLAVGRAHLSSPGPCWRSGVRTSHGLARVGGRAGVPLMPWTSRLCAPYGPDSLALAPALVRGRAAARYAVAAVAAAPPMDTKLNNATTTLFEGIVAAVEATDPDHVNAKYWKAREKRAAASAQRLADGQAAGQPSG